MGNFNLNGAFTHCPDPSSWDAGAYEEIGTYTDGAPLLQGKEKMTLHWRALSQQQFGELKAAWNTNKGSAVAGSLPDPDDSSLSWDSVTAYFHEPAGQLDGRVWRNVAMRVTYITR